MDDKIKKSDRIMIAATIVIAAGTLVSAAAIALQWREMVGGGRQTESLISAAKINAKAAESFAASAEKVETKIDVAESDLAEMAKEFKHAIQTTQDENVLDQRAWVGVEGVQMTQFEAGKPFVIDVTLFNSGKTPARSTHHSMGFTLSPFAISGPSRESIKTMEAELPYSPGQALAPQGKTGIKGGGGPESGPLDQSIVSAHIVSGAELQAAYDSIKAATTILYLFGEFRYRDISNSTHTTQFCVFLANPDTKELRFCQLFNEMN